MDENKRIVRDFFEKVYNRREWERVLVSFSANYYEHRPDGARTHHEALEIIQSAFEVFPDLKVSIQETISERDVVAVRVQFSGTPQKKYMDALPVEALITWEAMEFFRIEKGLIAESWGSWPNYEILEQMRAAVPTIPSLSKSGSVQTSK